MLGAHHLDTSAVRAVTMPDHNGGYDFGNVALVRGACQPSAAHIMAYIVEMLALDDKSFSMENYVEF